MSVRSSLLQTVLKGEKKNQCFQNLNHRHHHYIRILGFQSSSKQQQAEINKYVVAKRREA
jgi:hypothetical protein